MHGRRCRKICRIGDIATVHSGVGFPLSFQGQINGDFPFYKVSDMNLSGNEVFMMSHNNAISDDVRRKLRAKPFPAGSVVFPKIGAAIATSKKRMITRPSCADNNVMAIVPNNDLLLPQFLLYLLKNKDLSDFASDSNPPSIRKTEVEGWEIELPPLDEQRRVVDILDYAASIRRLRRQAQETARQIVPALFNKMFGDPDQNPMGWPVRLLGSLLCESPRNGLSPSRTGSHSDSVLTLSAITRGGFDVTAVKQAKFARPVAQRERVSGLDFLVTRGNGTFDLVGRGEFPTCDMPHVAFPDTIIAVRPNQQEISSEFLAAFWNTAHARRYMAAKAQTTNGTFKLNQTAIANIPIMTPPLEAQLSFAPLASALNRASRLQSRAETLSDAATQSIQSSLFG